MAGQSPEVCEPLPVPLAVLADLGVPPGPVVQEVPEHEVAGVCAEGHEVTRVKLPLRADMEGDDVVDFQVFRPPAGYAGGFLGEVRFPHPGPLARPAGTEQVVPEP